MGSDTEVEGGGGRYSATFSRDWNIWGPNGGYVAAVALRAAGAHTSFARPASLVCHYLGVASFDTVDIETVTLRASKRAESVRVSITQDGNAILEALVWCVAADLGGLHHLPATKPDVPPPDDLKSIAELEGRTDPPRDRGFWINFDQRPPNWLPPEEWERRTEFEHKFTSWFRYVPQSTFPNDQYLDAARLAILVDTFQWPAASSGYAPGTLTHMAPSLDLQVSFHALEPSSEWLLVDAESQYAGDGLVGGRATVWSETGQLLASGSQQMLCRPIQP